MMIYRIAYGIVLAVFLGNMIVATIDHHAAFSTTLLVIAGILLLAILGLVFLFSRVQPSAFWALVLGWEILFVWYAWFSPVAPFVSHEVHSFDAAAAAREAVAHSVKAGFLFSVLFVWFLSLPFVREKFGNRRN